jgi:hypothetical protein
MEVRAVATLVQRNYVPFVLYDAEGSQVPAALEPVLLRYC